jgi:hypothetical protein
MTEQQVHQLVELRAFLTARGLDVRDCALHGDRTRVRVPAEQEPLFRAAMEEWARTRFAIWVKVGQGPANSGR